jgi:hypothetical protein
MKNRHHNKIIRGEPLEDRVGKYIGVCNNPVHVGIVRYSFYRICEKRDCKYYVRYRLEK